MFGRKNAIKAAGEDSIRILNSIRSKMDTEEGKEAMDRMISEAQAKVDEELAVVDMGNDGITLVEVGVIAGVAAIAIGLFKKFA